MTFYSILAALIISLAVIFLTARISRRPFRSLWMVLLIVFLATWSGQIWLSSYGPFTAGISWYALIVVSVFVALLTMAFLPVGARTQNDDPNRKVKDTATTITGLFFWIIIVLLVVFIGLGYYLF